MQAAVRNAGGSRGGGSSRGGSSGNNGPAAIPPPPLAFRLDVPEEQLPPPPTLESEVASLGFKMSELHHRSREHAVAAKWSPPRAACLHQAGVQASLKVRDGFAASLVAELRSKQMPCADAVLPWAVAVALTFAYERARCQSLGEDYPIQGELPCLRFPAHFDVGRVERDGGSAALCCI